jgi:hypothetical protein
MTWMTGDNFWGLPLTLPSTGSHALPSVLDRCRAVTIPDVDGTGQDALDSAAV